MKKYDEFVELYLKRFFLIYLWTFDSPLEKVYLLKNLFLIILFACKESVFFASIHRHQKLAAAWHQEIL